MNTPFHVALIMAVTQLQVVPGADAFMPEAKIGNLSDPDKIEKKQREHEARWRESLIGDPLLSMPLHTNWIAISPSLTVEGDGDIAEFIGSCDEVFASEAPQAIMGPHPTTHMRLVQNALLRTVRLPLQDVFTRVLAPAKVPRLNIWRDVCPDGRGDCSVIRRELEIGAPVDSEVDSTRDLAKILGYLE